MRNTVLVLILLLSMSSVSLAQTQKGRWQVGSQVGKLTYRDEGRYGPKTFTGSLTPTVGYFVAKNLSVGAGIPLNLDLSTHRDFNYEYKKFGFGLSPFVQYYVGQSKLRPYVGISYAYERVFTYYIFQTNRGSTANGYTTVLSPYVGAAYFVTNNVALNGGINYNIQRQTYGLLENAPFPLQASYLPDTRFISLNIGFQFYFGR